MNLLAHRFHRNNGASLDSVIENRRFISNLFTRFPSLLWLDFLLSVGTLLPCLHQVYHTVKVFSLPSKCVFNVKDPRTHMIRLHFLRFNSSILDLSNFRFRILVNGLLALTNFSDGDLVNPKIIEYLFWVNLEKA